MVQKSGWIYTGEFVGDKAHGLGVKEWGAYTNEVQFTDGRQIKGEAGYEYSVSCRWVAGEFNGYAVRRWAKGIAWCVPGAVSLRVAAGTGDRRCRGEASDAVRREDLGTLILGCTREARYSRYSRALAQRTRAARQ